MPVDRRPGRLRLAREPVLQHSAASPEPWPTPPRRAVPPSVRAVYPPRGRSRPGSHRLACRDRLALGAPLGARSWRLAPAARGGLLRAHLHRLNTLRVVGTRLIETISAD